MSLHRIDISQFDGFLPRGQISLGLLTRRHRHPGFRTSLALGLDHRRPVILVVLVLALFGLFRIRSDGDRRRAARRDLGERSRGEDEARCEGWSSLSCRPAERQARSSGCE